MINSDKKNFSLWRILVKYNRWYFTMIGVVVTINCLVCLAMTDRFAAQVMISDEPKETGLLLGMNNLASWIKNGKLPNTQNEGINNPEVYPRILHSQDLVTAVSNTYLVKYNCTLYEYVANLKQKRVWDGPWHWLADESNDNRQDILSTIKNNIKYSIAPFYHTITIQYTDKDPDVALAIVNAVTEQLQKKISQQKSLMLHQTLQYAIKKRKDLGKSYHAAQRRYYVFADAQKDPDLPSVKNRIEQLGKERDDIFSLYRDACVSEQRIRFLLMNKLSVFSVIKKAYAPINPIAPKPLPYLIAFMGLGFILTSWMVFYREKAKMGKNTITKINIY